MSNEYDLESLFDKTMHEDDILNERYDKAVKKKYQVDVDKSEDEYDESFDKKMDSYDEEHSFDNEYLDIDEIQNINDIEVLIDTGSTSLYQKERTSDVTGKKVKNYVDKDTFCTNIIKWNTACKEAEEQGKKKPPMPDIIGIQMLKIADGLSKRYNFRNYCVDEETSALTQRGWLKWNQITTDDLILSLDPYDNIMKWSKVFEVFKNEKYDNKVFKLSHPYINALVTPEHKFVLSDELKKIDDASSDDYFNIMGDYVDNDEDKHPFDKDIFDLSTMSYKEVTTLHYNTATFAISSLIKDESYFKTNNKDVFKKFLILCVISGFTVNYTNSKGIYTVNVSNKSSHINVSDVDFHGDYNDDGKNVATQDYKGVIWCPRTEYGTFVCKRKGTVYVTGNTYIDEMKEDAIFMAIRAVKNFDPTKSTNAFGYFNQVMWLAMTTRLKNEDKQHKIKTSLLKDPMYLGYTSEDGSKRDNINDVDKERLISMYDN